MRIGNMVIDTDSMTLEELSTISAELRRICTRRAALQDYEERMRALIEEARNDGFIFNVDYPGELRAKEVYAYDSK